ncbi:MAG: PPE family protein [Mycobacterium sp.]
MIPTFTLFPPEINSALIFGGAGSGPLFSAASAWDWLASDLASSASSFQSVVSGLASNVWTGPASLSMAAAAAPYVTWLSSAAGQAEAAANQARAAATAYESARTLTVLPAAVTANRVSLATLVATNFLGQNTPAIAMNELQYVEMWAQDVAAMVGYHVGVTSAASILPSFSLPQLSLTGLPGLLSSGVSEFAGAVSTAVAPLTTGAESAVSGVATEVSALASQVPLSSLESVAQVAMYPASMAMSPIMMAVQAATSSTNAAGMAAGAAGAGLVDAPKIAGAALPAMNGLGGTGGLGSAMSAGLGNARLVGAMSVPPTWEGSAPGRMVSSAMSGLSAENAAAMAGAPAGGGMPMMPMPMGGGAGAAGGMPLGRGGASPNMQQDRPSVVPRVGVG